MSDEAHGRRRRDDLPRTHVSFGAQSRVEARQHQGEGKRWTPTDHLLSEELHRPGLNATPLANINSGPLHVVGHSIGVQCYGKTNAVHHCFSPQRPLGVALSTCPFDASPFCETEYDVLVAGRQRQGEVLSDEPSKTHLLLQVVCSFAGALHCAARYIIDGEIQVQQLARPLWVGGLRQACISQLVARLHARSEQLKGVAAAILCDTHVVERIANASEAFRAGSDAVDEIRAAVD
mmetsp:Transcript_29807/g.74552  ORF Transcript_29807/g.74552 Transcript_29807/m.74552 type:complete len:235 (+) Transcript_29807:124-828(+)